MNDQARSSISQKSKDSNSVLNIGIGMLIGLIVALVVAYFAMSSGPFRDKANKNVLSDQQGNTDPNAPLYTNSTTPPTIPSNVAPGNEQGAGVGVCCLPRHASTSHQSHLIMEVAGQPGQGVPGYGRGARGSTGHTVG